MTFGSHEYMSDIRNQRQLTAGARTRSRCCSLRAAMPRLSTRELRLRCTMPVDADTATCASKVLCHSLAPSSVDSACPASVPAMHEA
eukprot:2293656-Rhodomonas_salina.1